MDRFKNDVKIGEANVVAVNDNGADTKVIANSFLSQIISKTDPVEVRELDNTIEIELSVQDESIPKMVINREIHVHMTVIIPGSRILLNVWNEEY